MNRKTTGFGVGTASIINIFLILCLTTFSLLSYCSSRQNLRYARKAVSYAQSYTEAEYKANQILAQIDKKIAFADPQTYAEEIYSLENSDNIHVEYTDNGYIASFTAQSDNNCSFNVAIRIPLSPSEERYTIIKWQTNNTGNDDNSNGGQNIWDGQTF